MSDQDWDESSKPITLPESTQDQPKTPELIFVWLYCSDGVLEKVLQSVRELGQSVHWMTYCQDRVDEKGKKEPAWCVKVCVGHFDEQGQAVFHHLQESVTETSEQSQETDTKDDPGPDKSGT